MTGQFDGQNDLVSSRNHPDSNDTEVQGADPEVNVGVGLCPLCRGFLVQTRRELALALLFLNGEVVDTDIDHRCRHRAGIYNTATIFSRPSSIRVCGQAKLKRTNPFMPKNAPSDRNSLAFCSKCKAGFSRPQARQSIQVR